MSTLQASRSTSGNRSSLAGFTVVEVLVVIAIVGLLVGLLLPAIQSARESARNAACSNNVRQLARAALAFHQANRAFPVAQDAKANGQDIKITVAGYSASAAQRSPSVHVWLLPFLERTDLQLAVLSGVAATSQAASQVTVSTFLCPSDSDRMTRTVASPWSATSDLNLVGCGRNNYKANRGNNMSFISANGVFIPQAYEGPISFDHVTGGASQTAMFAEACLGDGDSMSLDPKTDIFRFTGGDVDKLSLSTAEQYTACVASPMLADGYDSQISFMGRTWVWGEPAETLYMHVMPPNGKSCLNYSPDQFHPHYQCAITASSRHSSGVNMALCDGATRFVTDTVDVAIWQALGSRSQKGEPVIPDSW